MERNGVSRDSSRVIPKSMDFLSVSPRIRYRSRSISANTHHRVNGIEVYTIDRICQLKTGAYQGRDKIRDLYDICFICDRYFADLSESTKEQLKDALTYKGFDYFDYVTSTQDDALIDKDALAGLYRKQPTKRRASNGSEPTRTSFARHPKPLTLFVRSLYQKISGE